MASLAPGERADLIVDFGEHAKPLFYKGFSGACDRVFEPDC